MRRTFGKPATRHHITREAIMRDAARRAKKDSGTPRWWAGVLTLMLVILVAAALAMGVQYGLEITRMQSSHALYFLFFTLSSPGLLAGAAYESGGHGLIFELRQTGQDVCMAVNAVVYIMLILLWLRYHGDERLKK